MEVFESESGCNHEMVQQHVPDAPVQVNNENTPTNNNVPIASLDETKKSDDPLSNLAQVCKSRKRKRFLSQQQQRKNNKNWKLNKFKRQQQQQDQQQHQSVQVDKCDPNIELSKFNHNNGRKLNFAMIKFNKNNLRRGSRHCAFPISSKFFLPDKRPCKNLIIPPTKFLLGGNISDPLNLNSLQNGDPSIGEITPKSSPVTTPPKIEVIIPPNIRDPLHLLDPVDAIEYQNQLKSPLKRRKKIKHRNRNRKRNKLNVQPLTDTSVTSNTSVCTTSSNKETVIETTVEAAETIENEEKVSEISTEVKKVENELESNNTQLHAASTSSGNDREKAIKELKLDLPDSGGGVGVVGSGSGGGGRKRRISENFQNCNKTKVRRMDSMDKIVSPVVPQPGAWKRLPRTMPSGAPKGGVRNRSKQQTPPPSSGGEKAEDAVVSPMETTEKIITQSEPASVMEEGTKTTVNEIESPIVVVETEIKTESDNNKSKEKNTNLHYGNYDRYHGYRNLNEFMDVRLKVFMRFPHLFRQKDVLDIGCNAGHITIAVAKDFNVNTITGVDIDKNLIQKARKNVSFYARIPDEEKEMGDKQNDDNVDKSIGSTNKPSTSTNNVNKSNRRLSNRFNHKQHGHHHHHQSRDEFFPVSFTKCFGLIPDDAEQQNTCGSSSNTSTETRKILRFPKNVFFKTYNYVPKDEASLNSDTQQYDLIMCLSVTKWIHLNFGDAGLKLTFKRIFNQLRPGGKLILEAQNWASYKKKKKLTDTTFTNYKNIEFYPNKFHEYLLGPEVGFSHSYALGVPRHLSKGFRRPIQLYIKGDFTPSQVRWSDAYQSQTPYEPYRGIYADTIVNPRGGVPNNKTVWGNETPYGGNGNYSYRFTPSQNMSATSQYYNPYETDTYLPSYNMDNQKRQYCFASPLYSTIWSPPASIRSASHTPVHGSSSSVREDDGTDDGKKSKHVYPPTNDEEFDMGGKMSNRSEDNDADKSPKSHIYVNNEENPSASPSDSSNQI